MDPETKVRFCAEKPETEMKVWRILHFYLQRVSCDQQQCSRFLAQFSGSNLASPHFLKGSVQDDSTSLMREKLHVRDVLRPESTSLLF